MANVVIIAGDVSSGKTHSLKSLDPEKTAIINVLGKALPWRGSKKQYSDEKKNIKTLIDSQSISTALEALGKTDKEVIIVDDIGYSMLQEFFEKASIGGFDKFGVMGKNFQTILKTAKDKVPSDKTVIFIFHREVAEKESAYKIKLIGRMIDDKYNPLGLVTVCLFTDVTFNKDNEPEYSFITRRSISDEGIIIPAKSPEGMFESAKIPNDMNLVLDSMNKYYNGE